MTATTYFTGCATIDEIKTRYRELAKEHHPDYGGDTTVMQQVNDAYHAALKGYMDGAFQQWKAEYQKANPDYDGPDIDMEIFADILWRILHLDMTIEVIGFWVYAFDSFEHKDALKDLGFWFSKKHRAWVYSGRGKRKIRSRMTTDDVRAKHGSRQYKQRGEGDNDNEPRSEQRPQLPG